MCSETSSVRRLMASLMRNSRKQAILRTKATRMPPTISAAHGLTRATRTKPMSRRKIRRLPVILAPSRLERRSLLLVQLRHPILSLSRIRDPEPKPDPDPDPNPPDGGGGSGGGGDSGQWRRNDARASCGFVLESWILAVWHMDTRAVLVVGKPLLSAA